VAAPARSVVPGVGKACEANLAGKGQMGARAACRDGLSSGGTGPELVVIAAGDGGEMFAIARNETSNGEYAEFCAATGCAAPAGATPEVPITGASVAAAEKYAAWLSSVTGQKYRLPTEAEWRRAAGTAGDPKANCVVANGTQILRGTSLRPTNQGDLNALGLRHAVGNVQEWAGSAGAGWKAMGGAIGDPIATCLPTLARAHNGAPDGKTGFRLVREMR
jgi:formylglycine-generating enzyme required for sulfatase activity